jgi:hypothetical protein
VTHAAMLARATTTLDHAGNGLTHQAAALTAIAWGVCAWGRVAGAGGGVKRRQYTITIQRELGALWGWCVYDFNARTLLEFGSTHTRWGAKRAARRYLRTIGGEE